MLSKRSGADRGVALEDHCHVAVLGAGGDRHPADADVPQWRSRVRHHPPGWWVFPRPTADQYRKLPVLDVEVHAATAAGRRIGFTNVSSVKSDTTAGCLLGLSRTVPVDGQDTTPRRLPPLDGWPIVVIAA